MRTILNIIWVLCGGLWLALGYFLAGIIAFLFVITAPIGVASFRMASYALWPFGRVVEPQATNGLSDVANILWFLVAGWWLALNHIMTAAAQAVTIVGIPLAIANIKMIPVSLFPFGKRIVAADQSSQPRGIL
ncbi:YccF domain-containing protein [Corynebacterium sp. ES2794-CONJ1]|uniref:YccF domain-containing protein n=1 Tax=unclassified Corynebacterium TaxID=2624378 RepID=UPI00216A5C5F|nr:MULTISPECIES: YccF domain-containing protein [unclassified Corynebacterium]MCS4490039.1 YccF domain-containing protein [Corynebacterium sp. ES2775-CONJ]MCS4491599.1 YccF domain-containing protein [Corynebacterium sp. ES2715-CONJ3]MCS4531703.1 YccF domain-containing protein [Corynebacterium sp. ES2730-CONJ]MCU9519099.1 YccF domain-containing protein [Corynebacterium sp. ES2794-CONJ1]